VDVLSDVALLRDRLPGDVEGLRAVVGAAGRLVSWVTARETAALAAVRSLHVDAGSVVKDQQGVSGRKAKQKVELARVIGELPAVGEALASGKISADHANAFARVPLRQRETLIAEQDMLVADAVGMGADRFGHHLRQAMWDAEGADGHSVLERQRSRRSGSDWVRAEDGMHVFSFELDPLRGAATRSAIAGRAEQLFHQDKTLPVAQRRTASQRYADAFADLAAGGADLTSSRSWKRDVTIMIVADLQTLTSGLPGRCELVDGTPMPVDEVRRLALEAKLIPAIFDGPGVPLWAGRERRLPSRVARLMVVARDRQCRVPQCCAPAEWTQAHHIIWWSLNGLTDIDNLVLVCSKHHHQIHEHGAHITMHNDGSVEWTPPPARAPPTAA